MKLYKIIIIAIISLPSIIFAGELETRVQALEDELQALKEGALSKNVGLLRSKKINLGGYFVIKSEAIQSSTNQPASFRKIEVETIVSGQLLDNWSYFSEIEFESEASLENKHTAARAYLKHADKMKLERMWLKYENSSSLSIYTGLLFAPAGVLNKVHYQPVILATDRTLFLRNNSIVRRFAGANISGRVSDITYDLYGGSDIEQDTSPFVGGARFGYELPSLNGSFGLSYQDSQRPGAANVDTVGIDLNFVWDKFAIKAEYFSDNADAIGYYIEPSVNINKWVFYYRHDVADINTELTAEDDYHRQILGVNYLLAGDKRIKLDYQKYNYEIKKDANNEDKDYSKLVFELAFTF